MPWSGPTALTGRHRRSMPISGGSLPRRRAERWRSPMPEAPSAGGPKSTSRPLGRDGRPPVASYVAKYATKEPAMHPGLLGRILSESDLKSRDLPPHLANMVATAWCSGCRTRALGTSVCGGMPTTSATRATSSPSRGDTRPRSVPSERPGRSGTDSGTSRPTSPRTTTTTAGSGTWLGQPGGGPLRRRASPSAGRGQEGGGFRMAHPMRVDPWSEGKPPQAVRQASGPLDTSRCFICRCARGGRW